MILTILLAVWITCGIIYVSKEMASDIIYYWKECKESRDKYNSRP